MMLYSLQQFQPSANKFKKMLQPWTELTVNQVTKYTPISEATVKFHMYAQWSNICSTKKAPLHKNMDPNI